MKLINGILKWLAALMFTLAAGLLTIIMLSDQPEISQLIMRLAMLGAIALICSLLLRIFFRRGFAFLLVILAFISTTFSTLVIDYFYDTEYTLSFLTDNFQFQMPSLQDGAQLTLLLIISLPILLLFRKKRTKKQKVLDPKKTKPSKPAGPSFSDRVKVATYQINPKNWNITLPKIGESFNKTSTQKTSPAKQPKVHITTSGTKPNGSTPKSKATTTTPTKAPSLKVKLPKFGSKKVNNDVKLMGDEDHVCPYCLEEVEKNDPRGVAICKECNTWHHQDCWDVTGACGVAHRNKL